MAMNYNSYFPQTYTQTPYVYGGGATGVATPTAPISNQSSNNKRKIIVKNRSNNDLRAIPLSSKKNVPNTPNLNIVTSEIYNSKNRNNNNHKEIISETKSNHVLTNSIDIDFNTTIKERIVKSKNIICPKMVFDNKNNSYSIEKYKRIKD